MVNPLINDGALIGFWPLHEPSGSPVFFNYSPHLAGKPSGLSLDLMVHNTTAATTDTDEPRTLWPGSTNRTLLGMSGIPYTQTFQAGGSYTNVDQNARVLTCGEGGQISREMLIPPRIVQSGVTFGFWVNPQSDGRANNIVSSTEGTPRGNAKAHSLLSIAEDDHGFIVGVSGLLSQAAQNNVGAGDDPKRLAAFVHNIGAVATPGGGEELHINTPIESGKFTHLTFTYRVNQDTSANNQESFALYKDGRLAASGLTTTVANASTLTLSNGSYIIRCLTVGGSVDETDVVDRYKYATGWGHLVSGLYAFNRPLNEGEILLLHNAGGLQPFEGTPPQEAQLVSISDSKLILYSPFYGPGFPDVSTNHNALISSVDEGSESDWVTVPGPFGRFGAYNFSSANGIGLACSSGVSNALIVNKSFTMAGWFAIEDDAHDFDQNMIMSLGSTDTVLTSIPASNNRGFYVTTDSTNVRYLARFFPLGSHNVDVVELRSFEINPFSEVFNHVAVCYDDQTRGVALYLNGALQQSGTLAHSFSDRFTSLVGSGYPLVFMNAVETDNNTTPFLTNGAVDGSACDLAIFGRPLLQQEVLCLARSGINISPLLRTVHDPRLAGYWRCNQSLDSNPLIIQDLARVWDGLAGNLTRSTSDNIWSNILTAPVGGPWFRRDEFGISRTTPAVLASQLPLGITSGTWTANAGSFGVDFADADLNNSDSSVGNLVMRYKPFVGERDQTAVTPYQYIISFDALPSGVIYSHSVNTALTNRFNALLFTYGDQSANEIFYAYLTNNAHTVGQSPGSSGVSIVFESRDGVVSNQLGSGNMSFGVPTKVLFHAYWNTPYYFVDAANSLLTTDVYIGGTKVHSKTMTSTSAGFWADGAVNSQDDFLLQFGGIATTPDISVHVSNETGLGDIYLRNIFLMRGFFTSEEILFFAASGIVNEPTITGFNNQQITSQITIGDDSLEGYYLFAGASGEIDQSLKSHDLTPLAKVVAEKNLFSSPGDNPANNLRFVPGPLKMADLGIQASGITYIGNSFTGNVVPPFVASGTGFDRPDFGFSVGMWVAKRDTTTAYNPIISYGVMPTTSNPGVTNIDLDRSWAIVWDEINNVKMVISQSGTGSMYFDGNTASAAQSGTIICGAYTDNVFTESAFIDNYNKGLMTPGHLDSWNHLMWTYSATSRNVICYQNGNVVDEQYVSSGVNLPRSPEARIISLFIPQTGIWSWQNSTTINDLDSVLTSLSYFSRPLTQPEVRYVALYGVDDLTGTVSSGSFGAYLHGQDTGSGILNAWIQGVNTGSGNIGGYFPAGTVASGFIGGYISGIIFGEGTVGGWLRGLDYASGIFGAYIAGSSSTSGIVGGYLQGLNTGSGMFGGILFAGTIASGLFGGYIPGSATSSGILGGIILSALQGLVEFDSSYNVEIMSAQDFDSQIEIAKTNSSDFDAELTIFQNEEPPLVEIIIPDRTVSGLQPPFNQYFIARASGLQGKTINQGKWNFGDLSSPVVVSVSGGEYYPIQYRFASSGFYNVKFTAIDSDGMRRSAIRIVDASSGIDPVRISLSGVPRSGAAELTVDFTTTINTTPNGVSVVTQLLDFDDGQTTITSNPSHRYTVPSIYTPIWVIRDSRNVIWSDSLNSGANN